MSKIELLMNRDEQTVARLIDIWESAVKNIHALPSEDDVARIRPEVRKALSGIEHLCGYYDESGVLQGFIGVAGRKIEMLFIDGRDGRQDIGRQLVSYAVAGFGARPVDVNEQDRQGGMFPLPPPAPDSPAEPLFRPAMPGDAAELKNIARRVIQANYTPFLGEETVREFIESGQSDKEIDDGLNTCAVMVSGGKTVGFTIVNGEVLHLIMVAPEEQGKGCGSKLLAHIEGQMFMAHPVITLQTFESNIGAIAFYQKHGWREAGRQTVDGMDISLVVFQKARQADD